MAEQTYADLIANFRPEFGNANHITAVPIIDRIRKLQATLDKYNSRRTKDGKPVQAPKRLINELDQLERRVVSLIGASAKRLPYMG